MITDTCENIDDYITQRLLSMPLEQRVMQFLNLNITAREMLIAGIKSRYPQADKIELKKRIAALLLGSGFAKQHYNWDTEIQGY